MANRSQSSEPEPPALASKPDPLTTAAPTLRAHLALCQEMLALVERESQALRATEPFPAAECQQARKDLLPRLDQSYKGLKEVRIAWQSLGAAERARQGEIVTLLRNCQDAMMKIVVLDRENEQAMLRRGLLPASQLPSANRQRPHFVAELYRRGGPA